MHTAQLEQDLLSQGALHHLKEDVLPATARWLAMALRVRPVLGRLRLEKHCSRVYESDRSLCWTVDPNFQQCGDATIPNSHFKDRKVCEGGNPNDCKWSRGGEGIVDA